jgi:hypothetical protein
MASTQEFPIRYGVLRYLLVVLGAGPGVSGVTIDEDTLRVRMGWVFRAQVPLSSIRGARPDHQMVGGIGAHGWRGNWLVNGSMKGIVRIEIDPPAKAKVMGIPQRLKVLRVSVEEPDQLMAALSGSRR